MVLLGVILLNGITEEIIHRGFVFNHLRRHYPFAAAAGIAAVVFAGQHLYLILTTGWIAGVSSVLLAALLTLPLAYVFERGAQAIGPPAISAHQLECADADARVSGRSVDRCARAIHERGAGVDLSRLPLRPIRPQ
jgi:hypothetical protein